MPQVMHLGNQTTDRVASRIPTARNWCSVSFIALIRECLSDAGISTDSEKVWIELSGKGAALSGNRWNSKGTELIYCADSRALAMAEVAVHVSLSILPKDYVMVEIVIPTTVTISYLALSRIYLQIGTNSHICWTLKRSGMVLLQSEKAVSSKFLQQLCQEILTF
jgi:hypothetical protein